MPSNRHRPAGDLILVRGPSLRFLKRDITLASRLCRRLFVSLSTVAALLRAQDLHKDDSVMLFPANFMTVSDILLWGKLGLHREKNVRTIGTLSEYEPTRNLVWIQDPDKRSDMLSVDCSNISPFPYQEGSLYQFTGVVHVHHNKVVNMIALLYRCCEGLDADVYIQIYTAIAKTK